MEGFRSIGYPAPAWNSTDNQWLVVWPCDNNVDGMVDNEFEIFGQRLDGTTGAELGADFRITDAGVTGTTERAAVEAHVAYNSGDNQYLVVYKADDGATDNENEIHGQRLDAATGAELGSNDFPITSVGPDGSTAIVAAGPGDTVAYPVAVSNLGPATATSVAVAVTLAPELTWLSDTCGAGPPVAGVIAWAAGDLAPGAGDGCSIAVRVDPDAFGGVLTEAVATSDIDDPDPASATAAITLEVGSVLDIPTLGNTGTILLALLLAAAGLALAQRPTRR